MSIEKELKKRILVLDGAMGTMLQAYKFSEEDFRGERFKDYPTPLQGNNDLLSITQPEAIKTIHGKYFEAGADIIETNTFSGTTIAMADYQLEDLVYELNFQSAMIAKEVATEFTLKEPHKPRFVAGSIGPTNRTASMSPDVNDPGYRAVTFNDLRIAYKQQTEALIDGGVDYIVTQMFFDNQKYFQFVEAAKKEGINEPIIPGLKPIAVKRHLQLLPQFFSIDLPESLISAVESCKTNKDVRQVGIEWAIQQSKELLDAGVPVLHYYSMGKSDNIKKIAYAIL